MATRSKISEVSSVTGAVLANLNHAAIFPASHYATSREKMEPALKLIERDLELRLDELLSEKSWWRSSACASAPLTTWK